MSRTKLEQGRVLEERLRRARRQLEAAKRDEPRVGLAADVRELRRILEALPTKRVAA